MSSEEFSYIIINALLYVVWLSIYWKKSKHFNVGLLLLLIWTASAVFGILYEPINFIGHHHKLLLFPFFFMFGLNLIAFYPILSLHHENIKGVKANTRLIHLFAIVLGLLSILPFVENTIYLLFHSSSEGFDELLETMNERYDDGDVMYAYYSRPALICVRLIGYLGINHLCLLLVAYPIFFSLKKHKLPYIGLVMCFMNDIMESINTFARFNIAIHISILLSCACLLLPFYVRKLRRKVLRYSVVGLSVTVVYLSIMTTYRLSGFNEQVRGDVMIAAYLGQYFCEGMPNFAADRYRATVFDRHEEMELGIRKSLFRQKTADLNKNAPLNQKRGALIGPQFSTYIGNFYLAWGPYLIYVVFGFVAVIFTVLFRKNLKKGIFSFASFFLFVAYLRIFILGICYNTYAVSSDELVGELFLIPLYFVYERKKSITVFRE